MNKFIYIIFAIMIYLLYNKISEKFINKDHLGIISFMAEEWRMVSPHFSKHLQRKLTGSEANHKDLVDKKIGRKFIKSIKEIQELFDRRPDIKYIIYFSNKLATNRPDKKTILWLSDDFTIDDIRATNKVNGIYQKEDLNKLVNNGLRINKNSKNSDNKVNLGVLYSRENNETIDYDKYQDPNHEKIIDIEFIKEPWVIPKQNPDDFAWTKIDKTNLQKMFEDNTQTDIILVNSDKTRAVIPKNKKYNKNNLLTLPLVRKLFNGTSKTSMEVYSRITEKDCPVCPECPETDEKECPETEEKECPTCPECPVCPECEKCLSKNVKYILFGGLGLSAMVILILIIVIKKKGSNMPRY